jgi:hypothetical protein
MYRVKLVSGKGKTRYVAPDALFREPDGTPLAGNLDRRSHQEVRPGRLAREVQSVILDLAGANGIALPDMLMVDPAAYLTVSKGGVGVLDNAMVRWDPDLVRIPATVCWHGEAYEYLVLFPSRRHQVLDLDHCDVEYFTGTTVIKKVCRHVFCPTLPPFDLIRGSEASEWYCSASFCTAWTGAGLTGVEFQAL